MNLRADSISVVADQRRLLHSVSLVVRPGELHAVLGPNGAGKSTLLALLAGDRRPTSGSVHLNNRPLDAWPPELLARQRAVLPQHDRLSFGFTVEQVVALGRLPCLRHGRHAERAIISDALSKTGVSAFAQRSYLSLSGGERARVQLARILAQIWEPVESGPRYLLLDEPTASLDLAHRHDCMRLLRKTAGRDVGALVILHDPNLALEYADTVTLLNRGHVHCGGPPESVLTRATLASVYGVSAELARLPGRPKPVIVVDSL